eukprot:1036037-Pleurochrysis_carterae.AAC.1
MTGVVASTDGILRFVGGKWTVVEEEEQDERILTLTEFLQEGASPTLDAFLVFSSLNPMQFKPKFLPFLSRLGDLFDTVTAQPFNLQALTYINKVWTNGLYYQGYDMRMGRGPFLAQRINKYGIHIGSMTGLKSQTWRDPVAVGYDCAPQQTGDYSVAFGCRSCFGASQSYNCVAIGSQCCALGQQERSICIGLKGCSESKQQEDRSICIGYASAAYGRSCICIGSQTKTNFGGSIVLSASHQPFETSGGDALYINPLNVGLTSVSDFAESTTLCYNNSRIEQYADLSRGSQFVTVVMGGIIRDSEGIYKISLVASLDPSTVVMHSTALGTVINTSFVHDLRDDHILIYVSKNNLPSDDLIFEFVLYVSGNIGMRAVLGGETIVVKLDAYEEEVEIPPVVFSSWNIPFAGPTAADAMNETLPSDDASETAQISVYFTNDLDKPDIVNRGFETYQPGDSVYNSYNVYITTNNGTPIPWIGKYSGGEFTHPSDPNISLTGEVNGDICTHSPYLNSEGLVVKIKLPVAGVYELHDSFVMPTRETQRIVAMSISVKENGNLGTVVPRQTWRGRPEIDQVAFIESYNQVDRPFIQPNGQGMSLGYLNENAEVFFTIDNHDAWAQDTVILRFRLTCTPVL